MNGLVITSPATIPNGVVGEPYAFQLEAEGGDGTYTWRIVDMAQINVVTPPGTPGPVDVVVTNPDGQTSVLVGGYTYVAAPEITGAIPSSGPAVGGAPLTISGTDFAIGATVTIGGVDAPVVP